MGPVYDFLLSQSVYAHYYAFGLLVLAGFCVPVSEDLVIIAAAIISVQYVPQNTQILFVSCLFGAYISDLICYSLGRGFGRKILEKKVLSQFVSRRHLERMESFYANYKVITIVVGRFIPFGVRNAVFLSAGISRTHLAKFMIIDAVACTLSTLVLFSLGRIFAYNLDYLRGRVSLMNGVALLVGVLLIGGLILYERKQRAKKMASVTPENSDM